MGFATCVLLHFRLKFRFLIILGVIFSYQSVNAQTTPIELKYDFSRPEIIKNVFVRDNITYDSIIMESLNKYGAPGEPVMPFKTVRILLPQESNLESIETIRDNEITLEGKHKIEFGKTPVPLSSNVIAEDKPREEIYSSATHFPETLYSELPIQNFTGYKILVLNLYPVKYIPAEGTISYFEDMTVRIHLKTALEINPLFRKLAKDRSKVINKVDNPNLANTYTQVAERSHKGCIADPCDSYEYVIITSEALKNSEGQYTFQDLIDSKIQKGVSATIVTVEDIMADPDYDCDGTYGDGCSGGIFNDKAAHIRNFIKDAYQNWETEYVLLGGDGDGADVGDESGDDIIPARKFYAFTHSMNANDQIPADLYYAALDGNWNNDGDSYWGESGEEDFYAEVYVGRAPVDSDEELSNFVRKTLAYDETYDPYIKDAWMVGENLCLNPMTWGGDYKDEIKDGSASHGYSTTGFPENYDVSTLYDRDYPGNDWPKSEIISIINKNTHLINHLGHAGTLYVMRLCNAPFDQSGPYCGTSGNTDVDDLTNDKYCFIYSQGCYPGAFDNWSSSGMYTKSDSIGEHFVTSEHGAFAAIMNSRYGWYLQGSTDGPSQYFDRQFWDAVFGEGITNIGKANQDSKEDNIGFVIDNPYVKWCYYDLNLLGDPEIEIKKLTPLAVSMEDDVEDGVCLDPCDLVEYTITYGNPVSDPCESEYLGDVDDVYIIDYLPDGFTYISADPCENGFYNAEERYFYWDIGTLEAGTGGDPCDPCFVQITLQVNSLAEPNGVITNEVIISNPDKKFFNRITISAPVCCWCNGGIMYVNRSATGENTGVNWENAYIDLQRALTMARACFRDEIWVAKGIYKPTYDPDNSDATFELVPDVKLLGGFGGWETSSNQRKPHKYKTYLTGDIDGDGDSDIDNVVSSFNAGTDTLIDGFIIGKSKNAALYIEDAPPLIERNTIRENDEYGIYFKDTGLSYVKNCWIHNNGDHGIYYHNTANGGLIRNCSIVSNVGQGVYCSGGDDPNVINTIFWQNNNEGLQFTGCDVTYSCYHNPGDPNLCIPQPPDYNIHCDPCFIFNEFDEPNTYTCYLDLDSPCIDLGDPCLDYTGEFDINSDDRVMYGRVDMGADEFNHPYCGSSPADFDADGTVGLADFARISEAWLTDPLDQNWDPCCDLDYDDEIAVGDMLYLSEDWLFMLCSLLEQKYAENGPGTGMPPCPLYGGTGQQQIFSSGTADQSVASPPPELTIKEQIEQLKDIIVLLDEIWQTHREELIKEISEEEWFEVTDMINKELEKLIEQLN